MFVIQYLYNNNISFTGTWNQSRKNFPQTLKDIQLVNKGHNVNYSIEGTSIIFSYIKAKSKYNLYPINILEILVITITGIIKRRKNRK